MINTNVISASINRRKTATKLAEPILYTLEHKTVSEQQQLSQSTAVSVKYVVYWVAVGTTFISNYSRGEIEHVFISRKLRQWCWDCDMYHMYMVRIGIKMCYSVCIHIHKFML